MSIVKTSILKRIGIFLSVLIIASLVLLPATAKADADSEAHFAKTYAVAEKAVKCFVLAGAHGLKADVLRVYVKRVGKLAMHPDIIFTMGHQTGILDTFASINAQKKGSYLKARRHAAKHFYTQQGCTINELI